MDDNGSWAEIEEGWASLGELFLVKVAAMQRATRAQFVQQVEHAYFESGAADPPALTKWHQTYVDAPDLAWRQMDSMLVDNLLREVHSLHSADLQRLVWVVWSYRNKIIADRVFPENGLPDRAGMASANAIGTIATTWQVDDDGSLIASETTYESDPATAGERWLTRTRKRVANPDTHSDLHPDEKILTQKLLSFLNVRTGRPTNSNS